MRWAKGWGRLYGGAAPMRALEVLARFAGPDDVSVVSYAHVARVAGITRTHARRVLKALEDAGLIERGHRRGEDGRWLANAWRLRVDRAPPAGGPPVHMPPPTPPSVSRRRRRRSSPAAGERGSRSPPRRRSALSTALSRIHRLLPTRLADQLGEDRRAWRGLSIALSGRLAEGWRPGELARVLVAEYGLPGRIRTSVERLLCARASRLEGPAPSAVAAAQIEATSRMLDADRALDRPPLPDVGAFDDLDQAVRDELLADAADLAGDSPSQLPRDLATHRRLTGAMARDLARRRGYLGCGTPDRSAHEASERVAPGRTETPPKRAVDADVCYALVPVDEGNTLPRETRTVSCGHCGSERTTTCYGGIPIRCWADDCGRYFTCPPKGRSSVDTDPDDADPDDDGSGTRVRRAGGVKTGPRRRDPDDDQDPDADGPPPRGASSHRRIARRRRS